MEQLIANIRGFSFGGMTYPKGGVFGPIMRPYLCLLIVDSGTCTLRWGDQAIAVNAGQIGLAAAPSRLAFHYQKGVSTTAHWCEGFLPQLPDGQFRDATPSFGALKTPDRSNQLMTLGVDTGSASVQDLNAMRDALGHALLRSFLFEAHKHGEDQGVPASIRAARRYIETHLGDETVDIQMVAAQLGITAEHLIRAFKKHIGTTPSRYLWRLRASKARHLLIHTQLSLSLVAFECGYQSLPHFSRSIKSLFGMTPAAIRHDKGFTEASDTDGSVPDLVFR